MATLHFARAGLSPAIGVPPSLHPRRRIRSTATSLRIRCRLSDNGGGSDSNSKGEEEAPESLFMKELKRRGMTPASLLAGEKEAAPEAEAAAEEREEGGVTSGAAGRRRGVAAAEFEKAVSSQRERSMALNSEGLEGLIPRAKLLLSIGGTFFLGFWPLMVITISLFAVLYTYFGPSFVHDASKMSLSPPPYIDPYALLEDERLSQVRPNVY